MKKEIILPAIKSVLGKITKIISIKRHQESTRYGHVDVLQIVNRTKKCCVILMFLIHKLFMYIGIWSFFVMCCVVAGVPMFKRNLQKYKV